MEGLPQWLRGNGSTCNAEDSGDTGSVPGPNLGKLSVSRGSSPGEGRGNPLQHSCLENRTDRAACRATVHRVTKESTTTEATEHACTTTNKNKQTKSLKSRWKPSGKASVFLIKCCRCNCPTLASKVTLVLCDTCCNKALHSKARTAPSLPLPPWPRTRQSSSPPQSRSAHDRKESPVCSGQLRSASVTCSPPQS